MKTYKRWKFLRKGFKSENGDQKWKIGEWVKVDGELDICSWGLHASKKPYEAFNYVQGEILALVECRGEHITESDKECWREQRVIKAWKWTKKDSVSLAIYSAELCLKNYEKEYPDDKRPREAIEAAKRWLKNGSKKGLTAARSAAGSAWSAAGSARSAAGSARSAAGSAWAAESAWSAAGSAWAAAGSAWSAAESARSAAGSARSAAESAGSAAESAGSAAWAAESAAIKKIIKYFDGLVENLTEIK